MPATALKNPISLDAFSRVVYQEDKKKVIYLAKIRHEKKVNRLIIGVILLLAVYMISICLMTLSSNILVKTKEDQIRKYETILEKKISRNQELLSKIEEIVVDKNIKEKAILELSMMKPTKNHIIYFDKTNRGYVHYVE